MMSQNTLPSVILSTMDEERFGHRTAKASSITLDTFPQVMDFCQQQEVELLIARCLTTELKGAQAMEQAGFSLMDTLVYYQRSLVELPIPEDTGSTRIRPVRRNEAEIIKTVAEKSFSGYFGHYHADGKLDPYKVQEVYPDWAYQSCVSEEIAREVLVAELEGSIVGFATLKLHSPEVGEGVLFGISPDAQRRGIYRSFMVRGMQWCFSQGAKKMVVSTQIVNVAVQKVWARLGFEPVYSYYTFHKWFK